MKTKNLIVIGFLILTHKSNFSERYRHLEMAIPSGIAISTWQYQAVSPFLSGDTDDLLTCSKNVAVKVSFVFVVWKEACK